MIKGERLYMTSSGSFHGKPTQASCETLPSKLYIRMSFSTSLLRSIYPNTMYSACEAMFCP